MSNERNETNPVNSATSLEVIMTAVVSFSARILAASSWEEASDLYMEARSSLCRESDEWARCVHALAQHEAPQDHACLYWVRC